MAAFSLMRPHVAGGEPISAEDAAAVHPALLRQAATALPLADRCRHATPRYENGCHADVLRLCSAASSGVIGMGPSDSRDPVLNLKFTGLVKNSQVGPEL